MHVRDTAADKDEKMQLLQEKQRKIIQVKLI